MNLQLTIYILSFLKTKIIYYRSNSTGLSLIISVVFSVTAFSTIAPKFIAFSYNFSYSNSVIKSGTINIL